MLISKSFTTSFAPISTSAIPRIFSSLRSYTYISCSPGFLNFTAFSNLISHWSDVWKV